MSFLTILFATLFYFATAVLLFGVGYKIWQYAITPAPLKIPIMPAPITKLGVVLRMTEEIVLFKSLFKSNKWIWIFGWMFHLALLLVLLRHLRYFQEPVWWWVNLIQPFGKYAGFAMVIGLLGLITRRIVVARVRYITAPSDHLMLILIISIALTGLAMRYILRTDIVSVKAFMLGLLYLDVQPIPTDWLFLTHITLVISLLLVFPFSKLLHVPGVFFSPTRNQVDDAREKRHIANWAVKLDATRKS
ncbi:MAG: menaquinol oxidoreductase [bacterium]|nr:MAG: menaquinol oxidoreductase [bacterium]